MLDAMEDGAQRFNLGLGLAQLLNGDTGQTYRRVQFVNGAVAFDAQGVLGYTLASDKASLASISTARVDTIESNSRFKKGFFRHTPW